MQSHLDSTAKVANADGGKYGELRYRAWSETRYTWGTTPTQRQFTGQILDSATSLYYYGARYYDPALGRFIQPDTIIPNPGNPQDLNRYSYVNNNPLKYRDPSGHWGETLWDIANILWDIYEVKKDPSLLNIGALVVDVAAAALPFVPGGVGMVVRGGKAAKAAVEVATHADEVADAAKIGAKVAEEVAEEAAERAGKEAVEETTQRLVRHHLATNKNWIRDPRWSERFQKLFARGGMSLDDAANIVELPPELAKFHRGPHSQAYHQWVYGELQKAIAGLRDPAQIRAALEARLREIAEQLRAHPEWLKNPPIQGGP